MELKVWVDSVQRVVCGVTPATTCQDVIIALAQAMGRTGRFNLIEQWRGAERPLGATDSPMEVLQKWGEYAHEVTFALCESAAKKKKKSKDPSTESEAAAARAHRTTTVRGGGKGAPNAGRGSSAVRKSLSFSGASFAAGGLSTCQVQVAYKKVVPSVESIGERDHEMDFENSLKDPPPPPPSSAARPPPMPQHSVLGESKQKGGMQNASDRSAASGLQQPAAAPRPSVLLRLASSAAAASYPKAGSPSPADSSARLIERDGDVVDARAASGGEERQTVSRRAELVSAPEMIAMAAGGGVTAAAAAAASLAPALNVRSKSATRVPLPRRPTQNWSLPEADGLPKPAVGAASSGGGLCSETLGLASAVAATAAGCCLGAGIGSWDRQVASTSSGTTGLKKALKKEPAAEAASRARARDPGWSAAMAATSLAFGNVVVDSCATAAATAAGPKALQALLPMSATSDGSSRHAALASGPASSAIHCEKAGGGPLLPTADETPTGGGAATAAAALLPGASRDGAAAAAATSRTYSCSNQSAGDSHKQLHGPLLAVGAGKAEEEAAAAAAVTATVSHTAQGSTSSDTATAADQRPVAAGMQAGTTTAAGRGRSSLFRALAEEVKGRRSALLLPLSAATTSVPPRHRPLAARGSTGAADGCSAYCGPSPPSHSAADVVRAAVPAALPAQTPQLPMTTDRAPASQSGCMPAGLESEYEVHQCTNGASGARAALPSQKSSPGALEPSASRLPSESAVGKGLPVTGSSSSSSTAALVSGNESRYADPTKSSEEYERLLNVVSLQGDTLALQQSRLALLDKEIASRRQKEQGKADEVTALQHLLCELEATCKHLDRELERSASPPPQAQGGGGSGSGGYADRRELDVSATSATAEIEALRREAERLRVAAAAERSRAAECERSLAEHELLVGQLGAHAATCRQQLAQLSAAAEDRDADAECERLRRLCSEERLALERLEAECERAADDVQKAEATVVAKRRAVDTVELELNARGGGRGSAGPHATAGAAVAAAAAAAGRSREDGSGEAVTVESTAAGASPAAPAPGGRMSAAKGARGSVYC